MRGPTALEQMLADHAGRLQLLAAAGFRQAQGATGISSSAGWLISQRINGSGRQGQPAKGQDLRLLTDLVMIVTLISLL
jgi:hypothetical protein